VKTIQKLFAAILLALALGIPALADGDMSCPPGTPPPPPPPTAASSASAGEVGANTGEPQVPGIALELLLGLLAIL
jgi:hypothetical protein